MKNFIEIITDLPTVPSSLPIPRTGPSADVPMKELSKSMHEHFARRLEQLGIEGKGTDYGDRLELLTEGHSLEVYATSDSVWYANRPRAYGVEPATMLPNNDAARAYADSLLGQMGLDSPHLRFIDVEKTTLVISNEHDREPNQRPLRLDLRYGFSIEDFPVRGPGAKVIVGLTGPEELAELVWFWRNVELGPPTEIFSPERALEIFEQQERFRQLDPEHSRIIVESCEVGYYAPGPRRLQRMLAPVYTVSGTEISGDFSTGFTAYVVAAEIPATQAKSERIVDGRMPLVIVGE